MKKQLSWLIPMILILLMAAGWLLYYLGLLPQRTYKAVDFDITTEVSKVDFDNDGLDDYADFLKGAKIEVKNHPRYDGTYYRGGYPPEEIGVCTDVIWRAFREAGYSLKGMVDQDIATHPARYPDAEPDPNIDFRRVKNLLPFFRAYGMELTTDINRIDQWQPGDIVIFNDATHIGMVSDLRNKNGQPYIIHNGGQFDREEDMLWRSDVTAHFRFNANRLPKEMLKVFENEE